MARTCILRAFGWQRPYSFSSGVTFVLFCYVFRLYAFVEADRGMFIFPVQLTTSRIGNLTRLIHTLLYVMTIHTYIHAGVPIATRVSFFFLPFLFIWRCRFLGVFFPLSLCMESTSYVLSFRMVFFLPCDHGLFFYSSLFM